MKPKTLLVISVIIHGGIALFLLIYGIANRSTIFIFVALAIALGSVFWVRKKTKIAQVS